MDQPIKTLRILILEDVQTDAMLEEAALRGAGVVFSSLRVDTRAAFEQALDGFRPDIVIADYRLPSYSGRDALEYTRRTHPHIPVVVVTGTLGDEAAVELLKLGARDYVLKGGLARLAPAVMGAISEERAIRNRKLAEGKYKALFSEAMDGILLIDCGTWQIVDCNAEFERQAGRTLDQLKALKVWELVPRDQGEIARQALLEIQQTGSGRGSSFKLQRPDGATVPIEFTAKFLSIHEQNFIQSVVHDISDRLRAEQALRESEARYKRITEGITDYQYTVRVENGRAVETVQSPACAKVTGFTAEEFATHPYLWIDMVVPEDRDLVTDSVRRVLAGEDVPPMEHRIVRKGGEVRWVSNTIIPFRDAAGTLLSYDGVIRDITDRVASERALRESEEKFHSITASAQDAILMIDNDGLISYWNAAAEKIFGYAAEELMGKEMHAVLAPERYHEDYHRGFSNFQSTGEGPVVGKTIELAALRKDGSEFPIELSLSAIKRNGKWNAIGIIRDIGERKRIEQAVRDEKALSDSLIQSMPGIFLLVDRQFKVLRWNNMVPELVGLSPTELPGADVLSYVHDEDRELLLRNFREALETGLARVEVRLLLQNGVRHYVVTGTKVETQHGTNVIGIGIDITERKQAENALQRANRALQTLSAGNMVLVQAASEEELLERATNVIVDKGGYSFAAVGYANDDPGKSVTPKAWSGGGESEYWGQDISWGDTERGQLPKSKAIRSGKTQICHDIASDPGFEPWREVVQERGYVSNIALPLSGGGRTFGCLSIYSSEKDLFDEEEVRLLEELANDLAYGIMTLRTRAEREQHALALRQSLEQSIQTIAGTVEARDPYTAGHQRRVAELATAIALEMELNEEEVNGIHLAATIHDLGKIHIPAEILAKPGRLSEIEFMLIKTHPQSGYNILKDVNFPWPIADIILQHHEKLDGSGYPRGLKGEEILLASRIMTVADVVEAMSSHRPYRPALGIDAALEEIRRGRGSSYDPEVADICLRIFAEQRFRFSS
jgi:PAS domain S-box-containing protein